MCFEAFEGVVGLATFRAVVGLLAVFRVSRDLVGPQQRNILHRVVPLQMLIEVQSGRERELAIGTREYFRGELDFLARVHLLVPFQGRGPREEMSAVPTGVRLPRVHGAVVPQQVAVLFEDRVALGADERAVLELRALVLFELLRAFEHAFAFGAAVFGRLCVSVRLVWSVRVRHFWSVAALLPLDRARRLPLNG